MSSASCLPSEAHWRLHVAVPLFYNPSFEKTVSLWMKPVIYQLTHSIRDWHGNELVGIFAYTNNDCILIGQVYTNIANQSCEADSFIVLFV